MIHMNGKLMSEPERILSVMKSLGLTLMKLVSECIYEKTISEKSIIIFVTSVLYMNIVVVVDSIYYNSYRIKFMYYHDGRVA
jgi:hypothetical protein